MSPPPHPHRPNPTVDPAELEPEYSEHFKTIAGGEILRTIEVRSGYVRLATETPDGALVTEVLTPSEAREFAEDLIEAARDAEGRR